MTLLEYFDTAKSIVDEVFFGYEHTFADGSHDPDSLVSVDDPDPAVYVCELAYDCSCCTR